MITLPLPTVFTVTVYSPWVNVAVTVVLPVMVLVALMAVPSRSPLHPANVHPGVGWAVKVTTSP